MTAPLEYRFNHIHVFCTDLEATARWFLEGMGAELVERRDSAGVPAVVLNLGGAPIILRGERSGEDLRQAQGRHFGTDHFGLAVRDIMGVAAELQHRGVELESDPFEFSPGVRIAYVRGPDGVRIELVEESE
jgi:catechol 2,3-dioxygenase-like lactoylglutathione lyase family enzyme